MSYTISPVVHGTVLSRETLAIVTTGNKHPIPFEIDTDLAGCYRNTATITMSIASPCVVTWTNHGLSAGTVLKFTTTGALPTGITAGKNYWIRATNLGASTFEISSTPVTATTNGTVVNTTGTQSGVHTATLTGRIYVSEAGDYQVIISALVDSTNATTMTMDIWLDVNGSDIADSNTEVSFNSSSVQSVVAVPFIIDMNKGDYFKLWMQASNTNGRLLYVAASGDAPVCPSIIMTINKIGR